MKLILLGAPGSGKGTQAQKLTKALGIPQISTGDIFRQNMKEGTPLGKKIQDIIQRGDLVPDDVVIEIVVDRLKQADCAGGFIMDGFPRTLVQAEAFDRLQPVDAVINLVIDDEVILHRMTGRRTCKECGGVFHTDDIGDSTTCSRCGGQLMIRPDDEHDTVLNRLDVYRKTTLPLVEHYGKQGKLITIDSDRDVETVYASILKAIGA